MEKEILNKIKRFINLSTKFTKCEDQVVKYELPIKSGTCIAGSGAMYMASSGLPTINGKEIYADDTNYVRVKEKKDKTKADIIRIDAEEKALLLEQYYEYLQLQKDLVEYFGAVDKLTENNDEFIC
jgi:hypothetical protein